MNIEYLAERASIKVIEALTLAGARAGCAKLWKWLVDNASRNNSDILKAVEDDPGKQPAKTKVKGVLQDILEESSDRRKELANILREIAESRLRTHSQNKTVAARQTAEKKTVGHLS